jgi:hypothetical protein
VIQGGREEELSHFREKKNLRKGEKRVKVSVFLDKESADILTLVLGQCGYEYESVKGILSVKTKYLFISNAKFTVWRYIYLRLSGIVYVVVRDVPSLSTPIAKRFYLGAVAELAYPTKPSELEKCVRAMILFYHRRIAKKKKNVGTK